MKALTAVIVMLGSLELSGPIARPVETEHDFGDFWAGQRISHTFMIKNEGDSVLELHVVRPSCGGCSLVGSYDREIAPGASGKFPVAIETRNFNGRFTKTVTLTTNDPANSTIRMQVSGVAWPRVSVEPPSAAFSQIQADAVLSKVLTITNHTDQSLELGLEQTQSGAFSAQLTEITLGKQFELLVEGKPPYNLGLNRGTFSLTTNIMDQPMFEVMPASIVLSPTPEDGCSHMVQVLNHGPGEIRVTEASVDDPRVIATVTEQTPGKAYDIQVVLPLGYRPPEGGARLTLRTTQPEMATVTVPIGTNLRLFGPEQSSGARFTLPSWSCSPRGVLFVTELLHPAQRRRHKPFIC